MVVAWNWQMLEIRVMFCFETWLLHIYQYTTGQNPPRSGPTHQYATHTASLCEPLAPSTGGSEFSLNKCTHSGPTSLLGYLWTQDVHLLCPSSSLPRRHFSHQHFVPHHSRPWLIPLTLQEWISSEQSFRADCITCFTINHILSCDTSSITSPNF